VIQTSLTRLVANAYGAMATLPLFCVGALHPENPEIAVLERYDVWHSFLVVTRELLRSDSLHESVNPTLLMLFSAIESLRDAFLKLLEGASLTTDETASAYKALTENYRCIAAGVAEIARELEIDEHAVVPGEKSLRYVVFERTLRWFGEELGVAIQAAKQE
jgi:hypothetical protein